MSEYSVKLPQKTLRNLKDNYIQYNICLRKDLSVIGFTKK
jgi:hypothetical protein